MKVNYSIGLALAFGALANGEPHLSMYILKDLTDEWL